MDDVNNANSEEGVNVWSELEQKLDTAREHNTTELQQMAEIYKRLGKTEKASEIEKTIAKQEKIVPILSRQTNRQNSQNQDDSHVTNFRKHQSKRSGSN